MTLNNLTLEGLASRAGITPPKPQGEGAYLLEEALRLCREADIGAHPSDLLAELLDDCLPSGSMAETFKDLSAWTRAREVSPEVMDDGEHFFTECVALILLTLMTSLMESRRASC